MKTERQRRSFNAYSGTGESPGDFAARGTGGRQAAAPTRRPGRVRRALLPLGLVLSLGLAGWHYQDGIGRALSAAGQWSMELPAVEGSFINRRIRTVRVESTLEHVSESQVRAVLARFMDEGFFSLDVRVLKQALENRPWIRHVSVRRIWPDTLELDITEQRVIARWGGEALLSDRGQIFSPPDMQAHVSSLPRLEGPQGSQQQVMNQYQAFSRLLSPAGLRIRELVFDERDSWRLILDSDVVVRLGREALVDRLQRLLVIYRRELEGELPGVASIDLRYDNGIAVRQREEDNDEVASR